MDRHRSVWVVFGGVAGVVAIGGALSFAGRAWAGGIPATEALTFSGTLEDAEGTPLDDDGRNIEVKLWSKLESTEPLCTTGSIPVELDNGRFSIVLPDVCTDQVKTESEAQAEVFVDGASLGRTRLGAVPYAVEAAHATSASHAEGELATMISTIRDDLTALHTKVSATQMTCQLRNGEPSRAQLFGQGSISGCDASEILTGGACTTTRLGLAEPLTLIQDNKVYCALSRPEADPEDFTKAQAICCKLGTP